MPRISLFQYKQTVSLPRQPFIESVVHDDTLKKKDLRVCILLLTELNGFNSEKSKEEQYDFRPIKASRIAEELNMSTSDVKDAIENLVTASILEKGESRSNKSGYRFTF